MNREGLTAAVFLVIVTVVAISVTLSGMYLIGYILRDTDEPSNNMNIIDPDDPNMDDGKTIIIELYEDGAPITCDNFQRYVEDGFYDGLIFHRVIDGFMIQGGGFRPDMTQKAPTYDPIELEASQNLNHIDGAISMARTNDPNSATSQFFICDGPQSSLDGSYAVFGQVVRGMDIVRAISSVQTTSRGAYNDVPVNDVIIQSTALGTSHGKTYISIIVDF